MNLVYIYSSYCIISYYIVPNFSSAEAARLHKADVLTYQPKSTHSSHNEDDSNIE